MAAQKNTPPGEQPSARPYPLQAHNSRARQRQKLIEKIVAEDAPLLKRLGR
jgi:hypothetical protein